MYAFSIVNLLLRSIGSREPFSSTGVKVKNHLFDISEVSQIFWGPVYSLTRTSRAPGEVFVAYKHEMLGLHAYAHLDHAICCMLCYL